MNGCLDGIRVLELDNFISGPYGAMLLADMGAEVIKMQEVFKDPQIRHMGLEIAIERKNKPTIRTVKYPNDYSDTRIPHPAPPPELGEHNEEYLKSLGYDEVKIAAFKEKGII